MKITDCDKETLIGIYSCAGAVGFMLILGFCSPYDYNAGQIIGLAVCFLLLAAFLFFGYAEASRYYLVDDKGITGCFLGGKIKVHFNWEDFQSLVLCSVYVRRSPKPLVNFLYISTEDVSGLSSKHLRRHAAEFPNRLMNPQKHVYFKFKIERYQYIKQFCPLELMDKRKSKDGY